MLRTWAVCVWSAVESWCCTYLPKGNIDCTKVFTIKRTFDDLEKGIHKLDMEADNSTSKMQDKSDEYDPLILAVNVLLTHTEKVQYRLKPLGWQKARANDKWVQNRVEKKTKERQRRKVIRRKVLLVPIPATSVCNIAAFNSFL